MTMFESISPKISVVVPVRNGASKISRCLEAILDQNLKPFEIIVVDGHSTDSTVEIARKFPVIITKEDYGTVGGARQIGVEHARGDYIAFTDADCIPQKDWLENLIPEFKSGVVGVGGGIKNVGKGIWEESIALALDTFLGSANSVQDRILKDKKIVKSISGCNSIYRKKDIEAIGGFNVRLSINEDTDLNNRIQQLGIIVYTPYAIIHHHQERGLGEFVKRMKFFGYGRGVNLLWDLQVIPPILAVFILITAIITPIALLTVIAIYMAIIIVCTVILFAKAKKLGFLLSIPIVFILEHIFYTIGFWQGIITRLIGREIT